MISNTFNRIKHTLNAEHRIQSIDVFRGIAILAVVLFHFNEFLPYGYLGVDLFFVISGLLVGGILTKRFEENQINYSKFILSRGFKIWPSYYLFIFLGTIFAYLMYSDTHPDQIITIENLPRYLFFYRNYTGVPNHYIFDHVWSVCVEEHFYIILPFLFIIVKKVFNSNINYLFGLTIFTIILGFIFKMFSLYFTNGQDTYAATHNRIDALAWGVLLNLILFYKKSFFRSKASDSFFSIGFFILVLCIGFHYFFNWIFFEKIIFHSLIPFAFFLMIGGIYFKKFENWYPLRLVAYFSYNWYLWHVLFLFFVYDNIGKNILGLLCFILISFFFAILTTIFIEERFLRIRKKVLDK